MHQYCFVLLLWTNNGIICLHRSLWATCHPPSMVCYMFADGSKFDLNIGNIYYIQLNTKVLTIFNFEYTYLLTDTLSFIVLSCFGILTNMYTLPFSVWNTLVCALYFEFQIFIHNNSFLSHYYLVLVHSQMRLYYHCQCQMICFMN